MSLKVLLLDFRDPKETRIEDRIHEEADNVQGHKIKVQSDYTFPLKVHVNLRIEADGPGDKVDPADYAGNIGDYIGDGHGDAQKNTVYSPVGC